MTAASWLQLAALVGASGWPPVCSVRTWPGCSATEALGWNTAVSFVTNTNWQNYAAESTMSYFTQMAGLTV